MEDVKFVLKSLAVTIVVVFLLQIRVGNNTIEAGTHDWIQNSAVTELMRGVADGGIKVSLDFYNWICAKTGVGEKKKSSFWSFGDSNSTRSREHHAQHLPARVEKSSVDAVDAKLDESRENPQAHSSGHFHWGGGSKKSNELPDDVGTDDSAN